MSRRMLLCGLCELESRLNPSTPLPDLGAGQYKGFAGGLYANGSDVIPAAHLSKGLAAAQNSIAPRNSAGAVDQVNGKIVLLSIGMSNTTQEFGSTANSFKVRSDADSSRNSQVVIVDGAQGGQAANSWVSPTAATWTTVAQRLASAGVSANQVQIAWIKQADIQPYQYGAFPAHAQHLQSELESIVRNLKTLYPNIAIAYVSGRTMSYDNTNTDLNPEPYAYESSFATQWLISKQISGNSTLNCDPALGPVVAPWLAWGPYLWVNGTSPRSDGLTWLTTDLQSDLTHPSPNGGVPKVSDQLLTFFKTDVTASPWFNRTSVVGQPPDAAPAADVTTGTAPLTVHFNPLASDPDGSITEIDWNYGDGTSSRTALPTKTFDVPGTYSVRLAVVDNSGNPITRSMTIQVNAPPSVATAPVNLGAAQRSRLTAIQVNFAAPVNAANLGAITLTRTAGGTVGTVVQAGATGANGRITVAPASGSVSSITLSFDNADGSAVSAGVNSGSLADGYWQLTIPSFGYSSALGDASFRRLFGDSNADGTVDGTDFGNFGSVFAQTAANSPFDFNADGTIDGTDFAQFGARFGVTL